MNNYIPRLLNRYKKEIKNSLQEELDIKNIMQLPKLKKIVLNMGIGDAKDNKNILTQATNELSIITGQKPIITKAKNAISNFKIRKGDSVGVKVTLRNTKMYEFLDRFISVSSPRIRDFRGFSSKGFDGDGNYNFGVTEQIIFPEIDYDKVNSIRGMNITIVTNTQNDYYAYKLLLSFGFPIKELKNKDASPVEEVTPVEESKTKETEDASPVEEVTPVEESKTKETEDASPVEEETISEKSVDEEKDK